MTSCEIRYRLGGAGPSAWLVDCGHGLRLATSGILEGAAPRTRLLGILAERGCDWTPASGEVLVDDAGEGDAVPRPAARPDA